MKGVFVQVPAAWNTIPLFRGLADEDLLRIAQHLMQRSFQTGEELLQQGVWRGELFIVKSGIIDITIRVDEDGIVREEVLRRLVAGDCFGEMSLLTGELPNATARAAMNGEVWVLAHQDLIQLSLTNPELLRNMSAMLSERLQYTSRRQAAAEPTETTLLLTPWPALAARLAQAMSRFSATNTLLVNLAGGVDPEHGSVYTLEELGRGSLGPDDRSNPSRVTVVRGEAADLAGMELSQSLERLGARFRFVLVAMPIDQWALATGLAAYATRVIVAGPASSLPELRSHLDRVAPMSGPKQDVHALLIEANETLLPTPRILEQLAIDLGRPVAGIVRSLTDGTGVPAEENIAAVARWLVHKRVGVAFGAGGAKGWALVGVLRVLQRFGIPMDMVAGSSVGSIIAGGIALGLSTDKIEERFGETQKRLVPVLPLHGVIGNRRIASWARELTQEQLIEDLPLPFAAVAADLVEGREIILRRGPLWLAIVASVAIPGVFPAVRVGRHWLVDGGVVNPVPVGTARQLGADIVIAVDLSEPLAPVEEPQPGRPPSRRPPLLHRNVLRSHDIMTSEIRAHAVDGAHVLIKPGVGGVALRKFGEGVQFISAGEKATEAALPELRRYLPWLASPTLLD